MRLAAVIAANYGESPSLQSYPGGVQSANSVFQRLSGEDVGFTVEWMAARRDLPETLEAWLRGQGGWVESLYLHYSGYVAWRDKRGIALALDGERARAVPLAQLCTLLDRYCGEYFLALDAVLVSARYPRALVADSFAEALAVHVRASGVLAVQPPDTTGEDSAYSRLALWGLDCLKNRHPVTASAWYAQIESELAKLEPSHTFRFANGGSEFVLLPDRGPVWSLPPAPAPPVTTSLADQIAVLEMQADGFAAREEWEDLATAYEGILSRSAGSAAHAAALKVASVAWSKLGDPARAVRVLSEVIATDGGSAETHLALSDLYASAHQLDVAIDCCVAGIQMDQHAVAGYRRVSDLFDQAGMRDRAWNAASVLAALDAGEQRHREFADEHRPLGLLAARATLAEDHWKGLDIRPQRHRTLERIVELVAGPAMEHRLKVLQKKRLLSTLDPSTKQDPQTSTTTVGRSLAWTAKLNNVDCPELYVYDSDEAKMGPEPAPAPVCLVSKAFARGFSLPQLTFLWGRTLTYFRPEHYPLVFFSSVADMASLLLAAAYASDWSAERARLLDPDTARLAGHLRKQVAPAHLDEIRSVTQQLTMPKARSRVERWVNAIDEAANRAGLIACGDVRVAAEMIARFPSRGPDSVRAHIGDVFQYSIRSEYAAIREHLGVALAG
jgi:hypothetical protein